MTGKHAGLCFAVTMAWVAAGLASAHGGGATFGDDDDNGANQGPYFFGFIRDSGGSAVADAKVTATLKAGGALVTRSNGMGVYKIPGFGKDVDPDSVDISCAKDGYAQDSVVRRPHTAGDTADPVEIECMLKKE
jgi:hypothetical protein